MPCFILRKTTDAVSEMAEKKTKKEQDKINLGAGAGKATQFQSGEKAVSAGRKGGKQSGVAKRESKTIRELLKKIMNTAVTNPEFQQYMQDAGFITDAADQNVKGLLITSVIQNGIMRGDPRILAMIYDMLGEDKEAEAEEKESTFKLDPLLIADGFNALRRDILKGAHTEYVLKGGRGSTKSSYLSLQGIELLLNNPSMHWLVLRQVSNTLRDSVYNQIMWAIDMLGLADQFTYTKNPLEMTYKKTGQKIFFRGADDPLKIKSIKMPFGYIGILWFEELDQFKGEEAVRNVEQSAIRGGDIAYIFKSFNPPKTANNWANMYVTIPKEKRLVNHSSYLDVPPEWLGRVFIEEAEYLKGVNPKAYEHEYMGVPNANGGAVFENVVCEEISDAEVKQFDRIYRGVDWGWYPDPYAYVACYYDAARLTLYIYDEYRTNKKSNRETADELFARGVGDDEVICDSAEPKSIGDYRSYGLRARPVDKGAGSVDYSMKWLQSLAKIVIDPKRCPETMAEFLNYEYERNKDDEIISGYPDANNHSIDAVRYAMSPVWRRRGQ